METLRIFSAGVATAVVKDRAAEWQALHPECPAEIEFGGSVDLIRRVRGGEPCDLLIMADDTIINTMLTPDHAEGCRIFARNKMVIAAGAGKTIDNNNWIEKLLAPGAVFMHMNPYGDPGGYRAVMSILLADQVRAGLSARLMNHPGHIGMDRNLTMQNMPPWDYSFTYRSMAVFRGLTFAELPPVMDLSDPAMENIYNSVTFSVDEGNTVRGSAIRHGLTIPRSAQNPDAAGEFEKLFMGSDFAHYGFLSC
jgi:ABC-type molybdate transport system substrate-binding protein